MTLTQAKRWYEFLVGQITTDIDGVICVRTLDGKLHPIPAVDNHFAAEHMGWLCTIWKSKKTGVTKNLGVVGDGTWRLTESEVDYVWEMNFGDA